MSFITSYFKATPKRERNSQNETRPLSLSSSDNDDAREKRAKSSSPIKDIIFRGEPQEGNAEPNRPASSASAPSASASVSSVPQNPERPLSPFESAVSDSPPSIEEDDIRQPHRSNNRSEPAPLRGGEAIPWSDDTVHLPCSFSYNFAVPSRRSGGGGGGHHHGSSHYQQPTIVSKWDLIKRVLSQPINSSIDIENAILKINRDIAQKWDFQGLHSFFAEELSIEDDEHFFSVTIPAMTSLALSMPDLFPDAIPLLRANTDSVLTLSHQQIACLLVHCFFCTIPDRRKHGPRGSFPSINFNSLFMAHGSYMQPCARWQAAKLHCLIRYFSVVTAQMPNGLVTFHRQAPEQFPDWANSTTTLTPLTTRFDGTIEDDADGCLQVDFANRYIGGGVLGRGAVQEEIRFLISPELIISRLFTEELQDREAVLIKGALRFSNYRGYASSSFQYAGPYPHTFGVALDSSGRADITLSAIDALNFGGEHDVDQQFRPTVMRRELNKAFAGFLSSPFIDVERPVDSDEEENGKEQEEDEEEKKEQSRQNVAPPVATGWWGCGAFGGNKGLKAIIQWMAAAETHRPVLFFTFGDERMAKRLQQIHDQLTSNQITIGQLWKCLCEYYKKFTGLGGDSALTDLLEFLPIFFSWPVLPLSPRVASPEYVMDPPSFSEGSLDIVPEAEGELLPQLEEPNVSAADEIEEVPSDESVGQQSFL